MYRDKLHEKLVEALQAVLPIIIIVLLLSFTVAPLPSSILLAYLFGGLMLILGMMFFSLGAELAMQPMGEQLGSGITKTRKLAILLPAGFLLGFLEGESVKRCIHYGLASAKETLLTKQTVSSVLSRDFLEQYQSK